MSRVVVINSLSYTGTTWLNTVLGCHERAFTLGPSDRALSMCKEGKDGDKICLVHGNSCDFWPGFVRSYERSGNFFAQLVKASGKDTIITNNPIPDKAGIELRSSEIDVIQMNLIRDGRALLASYLRNFPDVAAIDAIATFLYPSFHHFYFDRNNPDCLCLRYEDVLADKVGTLNAIGKIIGLDYKQDVLKFWKYEHHITSGNQGLISLIKFGQDLPVTNFKSKDFYQEQFKKTEADSDASFSDERWREELTRRELFVFDLICGPDNERFGYERDRFTLAEISKHKKELDDAMEAGTLQTEFVDMIRSRLNVVDCSSPSVEVVYINNPEEPTPSMRQQFSWQYLKTHGIKLMPEHLKKLAGYTAMALTGLVLLTILIHLV